MIRVFLSFLLVLLSAGAAEARIHYGGGHIGPGHRLKGQPLVFATAGLDYNFQSGSYGALTTSRASQAYAEDSAGNYTSFAVNAPRVTDKGLLVEEARTNSLRNSSNTGTVPGSPGTLPFAWGASGFGTLVQTVVGTGTENGIDYVDVKYAGTSNNTFFGMFFEGLGVVPALTGQAWSQSVFVKLVGGSLANVPAIVFFNQEYAAGNVYIKNNNGPSIVPNSTALSSQRTAFTVTTSGGTTASIRPGITFNYSSGVAIDFTLRIGWPQLEQGAFASSPIRTTTVAVTRAMDTVSVTAPPAFGSTYSVMAKANPQPPTTYPVNQYLLQVDDGSSNNRIILSRVVSTGTPRFTNTSASTAVNINPSGTWNENTSRSFAGTTAAASQTASFAGGAVATGTGALPVGPLTAVRLGNNSLATFPWSGWIERVAIWPTIKLTDAELQAVTAP